jgi:prepilin-type N-terminal cleavage/methylation domain-containing protein
MGRKNSPKNGFTLLELTVVIAIMLILIALGTNSALIFMRNSRDEKRIADLQQVSNSLEQYKANNIDGLYPSLDSVSLYPWNTIDHITSDFRNYLKDLPSEPNPPSTCRSYLYANSPNQKQYTLFTRLENSNFPEATQPKPTPAGRPFGISNNDISYTVSAGTCSGTTFNYWINNP